MGTTESVATADDNRLSFRILRAVAEREGTEPTELDAPLYEAIDPDALETIHEFDGVTTEFTYLGYAVTVRNGDEIEVTEETA